MGLWKFLIAERIEYYDSTEETKHLVSKVDPEFAHRSLAVSEARDYCSGTA